MRGQARPREREQRDALVAPSSLTPSLRFDGFCGAQRARPRATGEALAAVATANRQSSAPARDSSTCSARRGGARARSRALPVGSAVLGARSLAPSLYSLHSHPRARERVPLAEQWERARRPRQSSTHEGGAKQSSHAPACRRRRRRWRRRSLEPQPQRRNTSLSHLSPLPMQPQPQQQQPQGKPTKRRRPATAPPTNKQPTNNGDDHRRRERRRRH